MRALLTAAAALSAATALADGVYEPVPLKDQEQRLIDESRELHGYFERQSLLYNDPRVVELVASVGRRLAPAVKDDYVQYRFFVLRDPSPNAFALPNGDIYIHTGMLARLTDTAQLAAILGHEVNHVAGHHGILSFRSANKKIVASMVLTGVFGGLGSVISSGLAASMYGFSRELEQEADDHAVDLLLASPYDAKALPEIYGVLARDYEGITPRIPTIWSTHPQLEARAERTREQVAGAPDGRRDTEQFDAVVFPVRTMTIRDYVQDDYPRTAMALAENLAARYPEHPELVQLTGDAWAAMGALTQFDEEELSNRERARNANRRVMRTRQEREAQLLKTPEGQAALRENLGQARASYERALALDANFAPAYRGLGEVEERLGDPRAAAAAYVEYLRKAPNASDRTVVVGRLRTLRDQLRTEETGNAATTSN
ncbi:MAG TPA: M48 family metalloprotease [Gammaproteobacteria bacterium]|nr:M48 family metalloprotease [Gammaproteobacteria bacterium]